MDFFLNSFKTIFDNFFSLFCSSGLFINVGMIMSMRMSNPAVMNAIEKAVFSAIAVNIADPNAVPVKNPAIIDPFIFPRSFFVVSLIAQASIDTSRMPMPHCAIKRMKMNRSRFDDGLIRERMKRAIEELIPPRRVYCFLFICRNESTTHPNKNLSAQGIMTMLAAIVVMDAEILLSRRNRGTSTVVMDSCIPSAK